MEKPFRALAPAPAHRRRSRVLHSGRPLLAAAGLILSLAILVSPCPSWSAERAVVAAPPVDVVVGESLLIPIPLGVRVRAKNPHETHESHELTWYSKTKGTSRGVLFEDSKRAEAIPLRQVLEGMMAREKEHNATLKIRDGSFSSIKPAPLRGGPWQEAWWYTYEGPLYPAPSKGSQETIETQPPFYTLKMVLWDGRKVWISSFSSRDKENLGKWMGILAGVQLNAKVARSGKAK